MNRKGLSQILFLIVAASVLMMAALTLIFAFQEGVIGGTTDNDVSACESAIQSKCQIQGVSEGSEVGTPSTCSDAALSELTNADADDATC